MKHGHGAGWPSHKTVQQAAQQVHIELRTSARWIRMAFGADRDALRRTICFCSENTARALLTAAEQTQAASGGAFRHVPRVGPLVAGTVRAAAAMTAWACRGVIAAAVAYDVITNLARTEDIR